VNDCDDKIAGVGNSSGLFWSYKACTADSGNAGESGSAVTALETSLILNLGVYCPDITKNFQKVIGSESFENNPYTHELVCREYKVENCTNAVHAISTIAARISKWCTAAPTVSPTTPQPTTTAPTTSEPTGEPTGKPTGEPTTSPTTGEPTESSSQPTGQPTAQPTTTEPTTQPTSAEPTTQPTGQPTAQPTTAVPTTQPTTAEPTNPTLSPTSASPSMSPTSSAPTTIAPTQTPTELTITFQGNYEEMSPEHKTQLAVACQGHLLKSTSLNASDIENIDIVPGSIVARIRIKYNEKNLHQIDVYKAEIDIDPIEVVIDNVVYLSVPSGERNIGWIGAFITALVCITAALLCCLFYKYTSCCRDTENEDQDKGGSSSMSYGACGSTTGSTAEN